MEGVHVKHIVRKLFVGVVAEKIVDDRIRPAVFVSPQDSTEQQLGDFVGLHSYIW